MKTFRLPLLVGLFCALNFGNVFAAPTITATQDDGTPAATRKLVGDTVTYTTTISNTAAVVVGSTANDATVVSLTNPTPTNTTEVVGVTISPIAFDDVYPQIIFPNIGINSGNIPYSVFTNDFAGTPAVTTIASFTQPAHGTVTMVTSGANIGQFTYEPAAGYSGADSFTYTLTNVVGSSVGTVNLTVLASPTIWFVNPAVGVTGTGTLSSPFKTVAEAVTAIGANTSHRIFLYSGAQTTGITLKNNGWLVGQAATGTNFDSVMGIAPPTGFIARPTLSSTKPALSNASGSVVTLADNNTILGVAITGGATGAAIASSGTVNTGLIGNATTSDVTISGGAGGAFSLGAGNGAFNVNAPITSATGRSVAVTSRTGGAVSFTGAISDTGTGISLTTNTGATISFTGALSLSTGVNSAFTATGGGTISATQNNTTIVNTLATTTGTALNVTSTTIAASGLTFRSISSNGAAKGIVLNNTGGSGGLTVTGNGGLCDSTHTSATDCTGGTIQAASTRGAEFSNAVGVTLKNMYFKGNATTAVACNDDISSGSDITCNAAIYMVTASTVVLDHVYVDGTGSNDMGILGNAVSALSLTNVEVVNFTNTAKVPIVLQNLSGTCPFASLNVHNNSGIHTAFVTQNTGTSTITFTSPTFINNFGASNPDQIQVDAYTSANITVSATNVNISSSSINTGNGVAFQASSGSTMNATLNGGTVTGTNGVLVASGGNGTQLTYLVNGLTNIANHNLGSGGITVGKGSGGAGSVTTGSVTNNTITSATCGGGCFGITVKSFGAGGSASATVTGNDISGVDGSAIAATAGQGSTATTTIIQKNNIHNPALTQPGNIANSSYALDLIAGTQSGDAPCFFVNIGDMSVGHAVPANKNTITGAWGGVAEVVEFNNAVFKILNLSGGAGPWVTASNNFTPANTDATQLGTVPFQAGSSCPLLLAFGGISSAREMFPLWPGYDASRFSAIDGSTPLVTVEAAPIVARSERNPCTPDIVALASNTSRSLSQQQLDAIVAAAIQRWEATGLSTEQIAILHKLHFEVTALSNLRLGESSDNNIRVDKNAGGNGWFIDVSAQSDALFAKDTSSTRSYTDPARAPAGRIDLLTAVMHEMGHALGLNDSYLEQDRDSLMYGYLTQGERRLPAKSQAAGVVPNETSVTHFLTGSVNIGTLPPNKSVKIVYAVTVGPIGGNPQSTSSQATVSGSNFSSVLATDAVAGSGPTITLLGIAPAFTSVNSTTFTVGTLGNYNVTANGAPAPTFSFTGSLPNGVNLSSGGVLSGTPAAGTGGTYLITITASNGIAPNATQNFTLTVNQAPAITTANNTTFVVGTNGNFQLTASGFPTSYTFTNTGNALPSGVTLSGSGLLSGTPGAGTGGVYNLTFTVSNGIAPNGTQSFTLTVNQAPAITSVNTTTFTSGTAGSFNVLATGYPAPAINLTGGTLPTGVNFGTGTLAGTPAANAFGTYPLTFTASNGVGSNAVQNFTLVVNPNAQDVKSKPTISGNPTSGFQVSFIGDPGTQYTIQFAPVLPALPAVPNWQTLTVQTANASGVFSTPDNPPVGTTQRFYRAIIP